MAFYDIKRDNITFLNMFEFILGERKVNTLIFYNINNTHFDVHRIQSNSIYVEETTV